MSRAWPWQRSSQGLGIIDNKNNHTLPVIWSEVQSITGPIDCQFGDAGFSQPFYAPLTSFARRITIPEQGRMPADILEASRNQNSSIANGAASAITGKTHYGGFATTHWSVLLTAQGESPAAQEALEKICRSYWRPLYGFVRAQGLGSEDAQDMVQEFFAALLRRHNFRTIRQEKGRLRSYLLVSLKRFLASERHKLNGVNRYQASPSMTLDELLASERADFDLAQNATPDELYERRWILTLLDQVLARLETEYRSAGKEVLFYRAKDSLVGEAHGQLQAEIAAELGMTENAVNQAFHRFRQRYRVLLREEIAMTVAQPGEVEDELRHFASVLRR